MKRLALLSVASAACACCLPAPRAARCQQSAPLPTAPGPSAAGRGVYDILRERVADTNPAQYVWVVQARPGQTGPQPPAEVFPSLASADLRHWAGGLPPRSMILTSIIVGPGDLKKTPLIPKAFQAELDDFSRFCQSRGTAFVPIGSIL